MTLVTVTPKMSQAPFFPSTSSSPPQHFLSHSPLPIHSRTAVSLLSFFYPGWSWTNNHLDFINSIVSHNPIPVVGAPSNQQSDTLSQFFASLLPSLLSTNNFLGDKIFGRADAGTLPPALLYLTTSLDAIISKRLHGGGRSYWSVNPHSPYLCWLTISHHYLRLYRILSSSCETTRPVKSLTDNLHLPCLDPSSSCKTMRPVKSLTDNLHLLCLDPSSSCKTTRPVKS